MKGFLFMNLNVIATSQFRGVFTSLSIIYGGTLTFRFSLIPGQYSILSTLKHQKTMASLLFSGDINWIIALCEKCPYSEFF